MSVWSVRVVKEEISKRAFFLSLFFRSERRACQAFLSTHFPAFPLSSLAPLLVASSCFANFCLNSGRKDAAFSLAGLC